MSDFSTSGTCALCGRSFSKAAMGRHLQACGKPKGRKDAAAGAEASGYFHLSVEGRYGSFYWMHLAVDGFAALKDLDNFLRGVWLECCGHMSAFTINGKRYSGTPMDEFDEDTMNVPLEAVLRPKMRFYHEYDYGSTTELVGRVVGRWRGKEPESAVSLLARNLPPELYCDNCGSPKLAVKICTECQWNGEGWLCAECAKKHKCGREMQLPVVNSPRAGVCGYTG